MLYIVMLPVKADNCRHIAFIRSNSYELVRKELNLPNGWQFFVALTDLEVEKILFVRHYSITKFLTTVR